MNEVLLDQIPSLMDLQRYLEQLSIMEPPAIKKDIILEQVNDNVAGKLTHQIYIYLRLDVSAVASWFKHLVVFRVPNNLVFYMWLTQESTREPCQKILK